MKLLFASHNIHKIEEARKILPDYIEIVTLLDLKDFDEVEEQSKTFFENAYIKAKYYFDKYQIPTLSDDSGLCVDHLHGDPGVRSARFSETGKDEDNMRKLLQLLSGVAHRKGYFACILCYIDKDYTPHYFEGRLYGEIAQEPKGKYGFGYDPIFYIPEKNKVVAEMDTREKNAISHRKIALDQFRDYLKQAGIDDGN